MKKLIKYKTHLEVVHTIGRGIMIVPQLVEILSHYEVAPKSTLYRHINKMVELNLLKDITIEKVKIVYLTQAAADLLEIKKSISTSKIANTKSLNDSMLKTQYVIKYDLWRYPTLNSLITVLNRRSNLITASDAELFEYIYRDNKETIFDNTSATQRTFNQEYSYLKYVEEKREAQLKGKGDTIKPVAKPRYTVRNLKRRNIYLTFIGKAAKGVNLQLTLFETDSKTISSDNFTLDMGVINKWLETFPANKIRLQVIVKPHRVKAIQMIVRKYKLKHKLKIDMVVAELEPAITTYFKSTALYIELNDDNIERIKERKTPTLDESYSKVKTDEFLNEILSDM